MSSPSAVFHRSLDKTYATASGGDGVYIITSDGRRVLDGSSGAAVSCVGHGNKEVIDAICRQATSMAFAHSAFFTSNPAEELAQVLMKNSNDAFSKVMFLSSGSEAVESALKLARQYHLYNGQPERVNYIGRFNSYHGNTLGALAAGNNPSRRATFGPMLSPAFHHVDRCFYQADGSGLSEEEYEDKLIDSYEAEFKRIGPHTISAMIVEPVVGATLGSVAATSGYLPKLSQLCKKYGILTIFDEVMCGMGRTGSYHAWQGLGGVAPDLQTTGKGLGGGYQAISAILVGDKVYSTFQKHSHGSQAFVNGHTYQDHSMSCAAALAVQNIVLRDDLVANCRRMGDLLRESLQAKLPTVFFESGGSLRGKGLFLSVDFGGLGRKYGGPLSKDISEASLANGAAVYLCSGLVDANLICPPLIIKDSEISELVSIFTGALEGILAQREKTQ